MKRVNIIGGPGTGKSTVSACLFASLKLLGYDVELVNEWVKSWAWQDIKPTGYDQLYIFAKQLRREDIILRNGGLIISDAPLVMQLAYVLKHPYTENLRHLLSVVVNDYEKRYPSVNIRLKREGQYKQKGRFQDEAEAAEMDVLITEQLIDHNIKFESFYPSQLREITDHVVKNLIGDSHGLNSRSDERIDERANEVVGTDVATGPELVQPRIPDLGNNAGGEAS